MGVGNQCWPDDATRLKNKGMAKTNYKSSSGEINTNTKWNVNLSHSLQNVLDWTNVEDKWTDTPADSPPSLLSSLVMPFG